MTTLISIGLGLPQQTGLSVLGSAVVGSTLKISPVTLTGTSSPMSFSVRWLRNSTAIAGETGASYLTQAVDIGEEIRAEVTLPDSTVLVSGNGVTIVEEAPVGGGDGGSGDGGGDGGGGEGGGEATVITLAEFNRDQAVFDTGAAVGQSAASVPLSGTADAGAAVEYRIVTEAGTEVQGWADLATADSAGAWTGAASAPLNTSWLRPEVRLKANTAVTASTSNRFAAGHVIDLWGQSEWHRMVLIAHGNPSGAPAVIDDDALQITYMDGGGDGGDYSDPNDWYHRRITEADKHTGNIVGMANGFAQSRPGEKFHVVFHTLSGTSVRYALHTGDGTGRSWGGESGLRDFAFQDGQVAGLAWQSWFSADSDMGAGYGTYWFSALTGLETDGSTVAPGTVKQGVEMDHFFSDMYDYARTPFVIAGPHRFESASSADAMPAIRASLNTLFDNPLLPSNIRRGMEILSYLNGADGGTDAAHPNTNSYVTDGSQRLGYYTALSMVQEMGLGSWPTPALDQSELAGDNSYFEIWSSAGAIITARSARAETIPHTLGEVYKVKVNGTPINTVSLTGGRIRITHDFVPGDVVSFGDDGITSDGSGAYLAGGASGENWQVWKDYPLVDLGQPGVEGIPVRGLNSWLPAGEATVEADPNTNPNLLHANLSNFVLTGSNPGWQYGSGWTFHEDGSATIDVTANNNAAVGAANHGGTLGDLDLEASFVLSSPDGGSAEFLMSIQGTGGGTTTLYSGQTVMTLNERTTIPLGVFPTNRSSIKFTITRRNSVGTVVIRDLTVKQVL